MGQRTILLIIYICCIFSLLKAQSDGESTSNKKLVDIRFTIGDTTHQNLFERHDRLRDFTILFKNNKVDEIRMNYQYSDKPYTAVEYYDMRFEGDAHIFASKYGDYVRYIKPNIILKSIPGEPISCKIGEQLLARIKKDSIVFDFSERCVSENDTIDMDNLYTGLGVPAKYINDINKLEDRLTDKYKKYVVKDMTDSIAIFRGTVDKEGNLEELILENGRKSMFSELVIQDLKTENEPNEKKLRNVRSKSWKPAMGSRGPIKSNIRIYTRVNRDGTVHVKMQRKLGTLTLL